MEKTKPTAPKEGDKREHRAYYEKRSAKPFTREGEEQKGEYKQRESYDGPPRRRFPPPPKVPREKITVTLETVVPELPTPEETLSKPDWAKDYKKDYEDLYKQTSEVKAKKGQILREIDEKRLGGVQRAKFEEMIAKVKEYGAEKRSCWEQLQNGKAEFDKLKEAYQEARATAQKLRENLTYLSTEEVKEEIDSIQKKIETSTLTVKEESKLIQKQKDLAKMQDQIPEYEKVAKKEKELKKKYDEVKAKNFEMGNKYAAAKDKYLEVKAKLTAFDEAKQKSSEENKGEQVKIDAFNAELTEIRKKMHEMVDKFYTAEDNYWAQQKIIKRIEYMKREKDRIVDRDTRQKAWEAEQRAKKPIHPYIEQMETCDHLVDFCKKFVKAGPPAAEASKDEKKEAEQTALGSRLAAGELKVISKKKDKDLEEEAPRKGKKGKKAKASEDTIPMDLGTLSLFDSIGLPPPLHLKDIETTIEKLKARKTHYKELPEKEPKQEEYGLFFHQTYNFTRPAAPAPKEAEKKAEEKPAPVPEAKK